ncbi:hypothetical protein IMZ48_39110 [Candidatus Bathyarchaeota archaeon]|nr:hypothetical protein [Candidatus Bathyarchaeota archaeon]
MDQYFAPFPDFDFDHTIKYYPSTRPENVPSLIKDSTIIVTSDSPITREAIHAAKNLQLVATNGTGTDLVDSAAIRELGITLCNVPAQNTESVAEHALALYYGLRRDLLGMHSLTMQGKAWGSDTMSRLRHMGEAPRTNSEETMVVFGYGALGMLYPTSLTRTAR